MPAASPNPFVGHWMLASAGAGILFANAVSWAARGRWLVAAASAGIVVVASGTGPLLGWAARRCEPEGGPESQLPAQVELPGR